MVRIFVTISMFFFITLAKAQFYVGGSVGLGIVKQQGIESSAIYKIIPEIGYCMNKKWALGLAFGYKKGSCQVGESSYDQNVSSKAIGIQPYIRYNPIHISIIDVFIDGCFMYERIIDMGKNVNFGVRPGVSIRPINNLVIVTHIGFLGAEFYKSDNGQKKSIAGFDMDASNFTLGLNYLF